MRVQGGMPPDGRLYFSLYELLGVMRQELQKRHGAGGVRLDRGEIEALRRILRRAEREP